LENPTSRAYTGGVRISTRYPSYVALLESRELARRVQRAQALLDGKCRVCPVRCGADRARDERVNRTHTVIPAQARIQLRPREAPIVTGPHIPEASRCK